MVNKPAPPLRVTSKVAVASSRMVMLGIVRATMGATETETVIISSAYSLNNDTRSKARMRKVCLPGGGGRRKARYAARAAPGPNNGALRLRMLNDVVDVVFSPR